MWRTLLLKPNVWLRILFYGGALVFISYKTALAWYQGDYNGFDVANSLVPIDQIEQGGPPKDGIPSIDQPVFYSENEAKGQASERILGVTFNGVSKAYPVAIMNWHEIVNDDFNGKSVIVTFCPLCGTGMAFESESPQGFGVSGLLYNSDMLLYDRQTESLWSQIMEKAISGSRQGEQLNTVPVQMTSWQEWKKQYPDSKLLSRDTGFSRNYDETPYLGYEKSSLLYFQVGHTDDRYHKKENVIGLTIEGRSKVWPLSELNTTDVPLRDSIGNTDIIVHYKSATDHAWITDAKGELLPAVRGYWFAWIAFHPDSEVFEAH
jgi:hypothetical protein